MESNFYDVFPKKKILIGMLHLAGKNHLERVDRAIEEMTIYREEGFDGAIVEDFHGELQDVISVLSKANDLGLNKGPFAVGVNVLNDPYIAFELADKYGATFIQFDTIQASPGDRYNPKRFNEKLHISLRKKYSEICIFGGVRFKYIPETGNSLEDDIADGMYKADAIVTTGEGTGIETPTQKLRDFRKIMGTFPFIDGAGVNDKNIREQIEIVDGAVIGSYLKNYDTEAQIQRERVRRIVDLVGIKT